MKLKKNDVVIWKSDMRRYPTLGVIVKVWYRPHLWYEIKYDESIWCYLAHKEDILENLGEL